MWKMTHTYKGITKKVEYPTTEELAKLLTVLAESLNVLDSTETFTIERIEDR